MCIEVSIDGFPYTYFQKLNGRWFGGQQVEAEYYDGWKNFQAEEVVDEDEEKKRLDAFGDWLEKD
jgi:hypothetical protein